MSAIDAAAINKLLLDTDCMTFPRFIMKTQKRIPGASGEYTNVMISIQSAVKAVSSAVRKAGFCNFANCGSEKWWHGYAKSLLRRALKQNEYSTEICCCYRHGFVGKANVQGEEQKKLDVLANELFINMLKSSYATCVLVSEENDEIIEVPEKKRGKYIICFDPLDGSSNIDCLVSIGSIFAIYKRPNNKTGPITKDEYLQPGRQLVAAGYALYGSATMLVVASRMGGVNGFILDPAVGEFILTDPGMTIPKKGKIYSINEGYAHKFDAGLKEYLAAKKDPTKGPTYSARYVGSMVADVHRTIKYGGIFIYPATTDAPTGKLRLLYEANPMSYIVDMAGGVSSNGEIDVLDVQPQTIHDRCPIYMGSEEDVKECLTLRSKVNKNSSVSP